MKFTMKPSPNYRNELSTGRIMLELTLGLLIVFAFNVVYYAVNADFGHAIRAIFLLVIAVVSACATEILFSLVTKKDVLVSLRHSYPWVTGIILTMMCQVNVDYYALIVSTVLAIFFAKLVFGGFGQNIFNPAAVGRAIIFAAYSGSIVADVVTGATPTAMISSNGWLVANESSAILLDQFGGLFNMFIGLHAGAIGETSVLMILLVGAYLAWRKVIDWRVPVTYLCTLFVLSFAIGAIHGVGLWYPVYHILTGGAVFGAVFMMTDPVTNPTSAIGRILFAIGCALLTLIIRINSALPEGVLYSILIMNVLTPLIEKLMDGNQIKMRKKSAISLCVMCIVSLGVAVFCTQGLKAQQITGPSFSAEGNLYTVSAKGFVGDNEFKIEVENGKIKSIECITFVDTQGIGDVAVAEDYLSTFIGKDINSEFDTISGATYTSDSVIAAVKIVLEAAE